MDSRKALLAILGGVALTTLVGILLNPCRDSSEQNEIAKKASDYTETAEDTIKDSVASLKARLQKMGEDANRMVNEGGKTV